MSDLKKTEGGDLIGLIHGKGGGLIIPQPFERDIFLFNTHVAGTTHIPAIANLEPHLNTGDKLDFFREPDNAHDPKAIVIKTADGVKIGYVPQADNVIFSRLLDAGKLLFARIESKQLANKWLNIKINVFLHE